MHACSIACTASIPTFRFFREPHTLEVRRNVSSHRTRAPRDAARAPSQRAMIPSGLLLDSELEELRRAHMSHVAREASRAAARSMPYFRSREELAPAHRPSVDQQLIYQRIESHLDEASAVLNELQVRFHSLQRRKLEQSKAIKRIMEGGLEQLPRNGGEPSLWSGGHDTEADADGSGSSPPPPALPSPGSSSLPPPPPVPSLPPPPPVPSRSATMGTATLVDNELLERARAGFGELPIQKLLGLQSFMKAQEALVRLEHSEQATSYANAAYRFANELIFSEFAHVAELRTSKASVSSLLGQLSVPFTFIDYFLKGITRFLVDYHLQEDAFSFEDGDKIVKISHAAYGMESSTVADPASSRPVQNTALK